MWAHTQSLWTWHVCLGLRWLCQQLLFQHWAAGDQFTEAWCAGHCCHLVLPSMTAPGNTLLHLDLWICLSPSSFTLGVIWHVSHQIARENDENPQSDLTNCIIIDLIIWFRVLMLIMYLNLVELRPNKESNNISLLESCADFFFKKKERKKQNYYVNISH